MHSHHSSRSSTTSMIRKTMRVVEPVLLFHFFSNKTKRRWHGAHPSASRRTRPPGLAAPRPAGRPDARQRPLSSQSDSAKHRRTSPSKRREAATHPDADNARDERGDNSWRTTADCRAHTCPIAGISLATCSFHLHSVI